MNQKKSGEKKDTALIREFRLRRGVKPIAPSSGTNVSLEARKLVAAYGSADAAVASVDRQIAGMVYDQQVDAWRYQTAWYSTKYVNQLSAIREAIQRSP